MAGVGVNPVLKGIHGGDPGEEIDNAFQVAPPGAVGVSRGIEAFQFLVGEKFHAHRGNLAEFDRRAAIGVQILVARGERVKGVAGLVQDGFHVALDADRIHKDEGRAGLGEGGLIAAGGFPFTIGKVEQAELLHAHGTRGLRELTQSYGVLLIADEIAVGFGRTGTMFACNQEVVVPDFLCLGKGLSGGYMPIAATLTNDAIYKAFLGKFSEGRTLHHGHTFSGNPLASAAALASLDLFEEEKTLSKLPAKIDRLSQHLCRLAEHPHVATTRQRGLIGALELTQNKATGVPFPFEERRAWQVCRETLAQGVWLRPLADVLYVMPPLAITLDELDLVMNTLAAAIDSVTCSE